MGERVHAATRHWCGALQREGAQRWSDGSHTRIRESMRSGRHEITEVLTVYVGQAGPIMCFSCRRENMGMGPT